MFMARFERQCGQIKSVPWRARDRGKNYTPSLLAKGLRAQIVPIRYSEHREFPFFAGVAGVVRESRNYNYKVVVVDTQEDERRTA